MQLKSHVAQGACLGPVVYYFADFKTAVIFTLSFILIDIDHYIHYIYRCKSLSIKGMFIFHDEIWRKRENILGISIFHTFEILAALFFLGFWHSEFWIIGSGFLAHLLFDVFHLFKHNVLFIRAFSFIEYFIRKKNHPKELIY